MKITETCRCGASFSVEDEERDAAFSAMDNWRDAHPCLTPGQLAPDPRRTGAASAVLGFHPQVNHDSQRYQRTQAST